MRQAGGGQPYPGLGQGGEVIDIDSPPMDRSGREGRGGKGDAEQSGSEAWWAGPMGLGRKRWVAGPAGRELGSLFHVPLGPRPEPLAGAAVLEGLPGLTSSLWHHRYLHSYRHSHSHCHPGCPAARQCPSPCHSHQSAPCESPCTCWCQSAVPQLPLFLL